jgi:hypothetical protein
VGPVGRRKDARKYLDEFMALAENPKRVQRVRVDACVRRAGMQRALTDR